MITVKRQKISQLWRWKSWWTIDVDVGLDLSAFGLGPYAFRDRSIAWFHLLINISFWTLRISLKRHSSVEIADEGSSNDDDDASLEAER